MHKKHAEVQAHRAAVLRAQNRNLAQNEYNNHLATSMHGTLHPIAIQRMKLLDDIYRIAPL